MHNEEGTTTCSVVLWFGVHVARQADWGAGTGAGDIPGSPYHVSLDKLDGGSIGERDNQMASTALVPNTPSITTLLSDRPDRHRRHVHDSATMSGATATAGGTVKYAVYGNLTDCNAGTYATPGGTGAGYQDRAHERRPCPTPNNATFNTAGTYYWRAFYSGDANNNGPASSTCTSEVLVVGPTRHRSRPCSPTDSIAVGDSVHDSATMTGATATAGGTVKYAFYGNLTDCNAGTYATPGGTSAGTGPSRTGVVPTPTARHLQHRRHLLLAGLLQRRRQQQRPASSTCTSEIVVVSPSPPSITTLLSDRLHHRRRQRP